MVEYFWSNIFGILTRWRLCRKIESRGGLSSTRGGSRGGWGRVPLGYVLSLMSASAVHSPVGRLWREIWEVGFTRSQLARSIARENPARTLGGSTKSHVTHYITHASIKSHVTFPTKPPPGFHSPDKVPSRLSTPRSHSTGQHSPNTVPPTQSSPGYHPPKPPPDKVPGCHPWGTPETASSQPFTPPRPPSTSQRPPLTGDQPPQVSRTK